MNLLIFLNTYEFFQNFLTFLKIPFSKKIKDITVKLLVQMWLWYGISLQNHIQNS